MLNTPCDHKKIYSSKFTHQKLWKTQTPRIVPPFSIQSLQKNTKVIPPNRYSKCDLDSICSLNKRPKGTSFRMYYERGDLPIKMDYIAGGFKVLWTVDMEKLDYGLYLPLFFDGLSETEHPYKVYARQGVRDLIHTGGDKIYPVIPQLIIPIKSSYFTIIIILCKIPGKKFKLKTSSRCIEHKK